LSNQKWSHVAPEMAVNYEAHMEAVEGDVACI
jgi:hypothetical protein